MQPYQKRVVEEKAELDEKLAKLKAFFDTEAYATLGIEEKGRLERQRGVMLSYSTILGERIAAFR